jgi:hypothetical protein
MKPSQFTPSRKEPLLTALEDTWTLEAFWRDLKANFSFYIN